VLGGYRMIEALALLPILYLPREQQNVILCTGSSAELLAADVLRWRDIAAVYLLKPPAQPLTDPSQKEPRTDKRVIVGTPPIGTCTAVLTSPGEEPDAYLGFLAKDGVICVSRYGSGELRPFLAHMRTLFPRGILPWREFLPQELYGCLASPAGVPKRVREPPGGARRLNATYIKTIFSFGADEMPIVFGSSKPPALVTAGSPIPGLGRVGR
jgi:hypothetical protein